ncbi:hypothetical protein BU24DRAFT_420162 [Aaosphaeria arxii CBS 175.79]|uniref:Iron-sulfur assembly protein 1 n=1 Tax=Aaosphaeria arxii CBS 175.79 TaxID=1450172 RepID=A0A6A5XVY9_9PLEO|nr:uncharacterized protein BU24DRAFT_420162 [Aaosphaeria arxii CBS 175.79]KAF2017139.1 hypothetical protein BU24DRAFT_420162 [Aaosphaeria arxii CBS 175.79]
MALPRTAGTFSAMSTSAFNRFAASTSSAARNCPQCSRAFSSFTPYRQSSKRQLQTATAYRPSSLGLEPPPRNFGVPNTSIAGGIPEVRNSMPSQSSQEQRDIPTWNQYKSTKISEGEAQKSQPQQPAKPLRPRRYKFGPRKATITLSPSAVSHLRELLNQPEPKLIRIGTKAKGCSGLAYHLEYVDKPSKLDEQVDQDGVKVLIDNKALLNIIGSEMDWLEDKLNQRFVFKNPNMTEQCGCGESFSVG